MLNTKASTACRVIVRRIGADATVTSVVRYPPPVHEYPAGSWGPAEAGALVSGLPPWQEPWTSARD